MSRDLSRWTHRALIAEADRRLLESRTVLARPAGHWQAVADEEEARRRDLAHLDSLIPHDDDGGRLDDDE